MTNLSNQPFLLSLKQATKQICDYQDDYEIVLQEQQDEFKEYVQNYFNSDVAAPKRFQFLKTADYKLERIHLMYADAIRENNTDFYRFWSMLITDTRRFISIGIDTLNFQAICPAHMLTDEHARKFPLCNWTAQRSDLMEAIVGFFQADIIRLQDGSRPSFALFAKEIGSIFGITYNNPHFEMRKILNRKREQTPFMNRIIAGLKDKSEKMFE